VRAGIITIGIIGKDEMAKQDLGKKRSCRKCGMRFYDFNREPAVCPGCNTVFDPEEVIRTQKGRDPNEEVIDGVDGDDPAGIADGVDFQKAKLESDETDEDALIPQNLEGGDDDDDDDASDEVLPDINTEDDEQ